MQYRYVVIRWDWRLHQYSRSTCGVHKGRGIEWGVGDWWGSEYNETNVEKYFLNWYTNKKSKSLLVGGNGNRRRWRCEEKVFGKLRSVIEGGCEIGLESTWGKQFLWLKSKKRNWF